MDPSLELIVPGSYTDRYFMALPQETVISLISKYGSLGLPAEESQPEKMGLQQMRELPHLCKPVALFLQILQIIFMFIPHHQGFFWFVILTTILMLIITLLMFAVFVANFTPVTEAPQWWLAEMIFATVFSVCNIVNFFYFIVNIFKNFNFFYIVNTGLAALQFLVWGFDAFFWFRNRSSSSGSSPSSNQATATPAPHPSWPAGANPA